MSPSSRPFNTLFTSAGRRVELLRAFRRAYQELELPGRVIATDIDPLAPALQVADRSFLMPRLSEESYLPALEELCQREEISLIFPLIDPDIEILSRHRARLAELGARAAVVGPEAVKATADKWDTQRFFGSLGLPQAKSWLPGDPELARQDFPLFIKPRRGSASQFTFRVETQRQLDFFLDYVPNPIVQELLPGPEITTDVIADLQGEVLGLVSRRRIAVRSGEVIKGVTVKDPRIFDGAVKIARALPAVGPITVQCLYKGDVPYFTEINARLGGGLPLGLAAGVEAPRWLLARSAGLPLELPPLGSYQEGLHLSRFDDSFFLGERELETFAGRGFRSR